MTQVLLSDVEVNDQLFPLTVIRSAADLRCGILTIREKWQKYLGYDVSLTREVAALPEDACIMSANIIPSKEFMTSLFKNGKLSDNPDWEAVRVTQFPWHLFMWNDWAIRNDFELLTTGRKSAAIPRSVVVSNKDNLFIEAGASLTSCIINAETGPVYIGKDALIMEGSVLRGPVAVCEGAVVKMGAKIYGGTTIGPHCIAGGEIKNSIMFSYSNKAHDGYLGDSVVGEWCNIGAGSCNSNVKNNAGTIKAWNNTLREFTSTGLSKCGLIMGDYSRASINTSFNTGTIIGLCVNVFGDGLTPKFIPSFSWGSAGTVKYEFDKAISDIENWMKLKDQRMTPREKMQLRLIFDQN